LEKGVIKCGVVQAASDCGRNKYVILKCIGKDGDATGYS